MVLRVSALAKCWWHMCVILATQEAEIRRITVQSQPIVHETLSQKKKNFCIKSRKTWTFTKMLALILKII
jgi:hypothetical protein